MDQRMPFPMQQGYYFEHAGEMHRGGADTCHWLVVALLLLLILLVIAQIALSLMRRSRHGGPSHMRGGMGFPPGGRPWGRPDPLTVARMRYAGGEIARDEYVQLAQDLGGVPEAEPPPPPE